MSVGPPQRPVGASPKAAQPPAVPPGEEPERDPKAARPAPRLPPAVPVNSREIAASNSKQARIKEAEEDRGLIARAQGGDVVAFRSLVERHQRRAFAIALALVRDENDARELVQEAFLRVYRGLGFTTRSVDRMYAARR